MHRAVVVVAFGSHEENNNKKAQYQVALLDILGINAEKKHTDSSQC